MVVGPTAEIYVCGLGSEGQLGTKQKKNLLLPTLVTLGDPPTNFRPPGTDTETDLGTSVDPLAAAGKGGTSEVGVAKEAGFGKDYCLRRVFAGGDQTFAAVKTWHEKV